MMEACVSLLILTIFVVDCIQTNADIYIVCEAVGSSLSGALWRKLWASFSHLWLVYDG